MNISEINSFLIFVLIFSLIFGPISYRWYKLNTICNDKNIVFSLLNPEEKWDNIIKKVVKDTLSYKFFWDYGFDKKRDEKIKELLNKYENENQGDIFDRDEIGF